MSIFFPMEIVEQILCRLPLPVTVRFSRVCKQWQSLIGSIDYNPACLSSSKSLPKSDGLIVVNYSSLNALPYPVLRCLEPGNFDGRRARSYYMPHQWVVGSIHNLICIFSLLQDIYIWHPVITRYIHATQHEFTGTDICMMILGFGFDAVTNDYKVVKMAVGGGEFNFKAQVFSLKAGKWRDIRGQWLVPEGVYFGAVATGFFVNGAIHWLGSRANQEHVILTFDVLNECFYSIELPDALSDPLACIFLCEIKGSLAIIHNDDTKDDVPGCCNIWEMRDSWTKICSFGKQETVTVVKVLEDGDIWFAKRGGTCRRNRTEIVSYNPSSGVIKPTGIHGFFSALYGMVIIPEQNCDGESGIACYGLN
ncbi:hypothetical protein K2173_007089 [Erythroxylum novogranatense]|uniref:F-box domain-containing protein n=1 Tax=Erythroxylum novogranatense TaxID=1862640 RepID=A0AAV8SYC3_9ROSI|nr:hypothetical protein K2173_007089 [Erythroxylum novogranatense]